MTPVKKTANEEYAELITFADGESLPPGENTIGGINLTTDLRVGAKSLTLALISGEGSAPIPDTARFVGVRPVSTTMRVGLEAPEAEGSASGNAAASDLKKGVPVHSEEWSWFNIGPGQGRTLFVKGGSTDEIVICLI
jgi:hypothetical protein